MLIRIVRMHFTETGADDFLAIFRNSEKLIRNFEGCTHLQLTKDVNDSLTYVTISHWKDQACLENYRKSELFAAVWKKVKPLFSNRVEAISLELVTQL